MFVARNLFRQQLTVTKCMAHVPNQISPNRSVISHVRAIPLCHRTISHTTTKTAPSTTTATPATGTTNTNENDENPAKKTTNIGEYDTLTEYQAYDMIHKLSDSDRVSLSSALNKFDSELIKSKFQGELAASKWRLKFSRRDTQTALGEVDPTGSYCAMPDDWLKKKLAEAAVRPTNSELSRVFIVNGVPFVGFGFLDNFLMIIAGDYIEGSIGVYFCLTTMAAAALGNTVSDVFGLWLATYVEQFCRFIGIRPPELTPTQCNMKVTHRLASLGRVIGITIGCILGMIPLLFKEEKQDGEKKASPAQM